LSPKRRKTSQFFRPSAIADGNVLTCWNVESTGSLAEGTKAMPRDELARAAALFRGRRLKRNNALTALASGALPGVAIAGFLHPSSLGWALSLAIGLLWANAFEYFYHRYLLHMPKSSFGREHLLHHSTLGRPEEPEHVTFGSSPLYLMLLFLVNGALATAICSLIRWSLLPGILTGFSLYLILVEEIHWRIHMGEWLPAPLECVREYHMAHHEIPGGRFNVFFPAFDYLFGNIHPDIETTEARQLANAALDSGCRSGPLSSLEAACLWSWMAIIAIGIRYFWHSGPKA
jgi:hypothetical protein